MSTDTAYNELLTHLKRVHYLGSVASLVGWDEQVNVPNRMPCWPNSRTRLRLIHGLERS
jgi:Zn-dependent M32 family carboxypeptidase